MRKKEKDSSPKRLSSAETTVRVSVSFAGDDYADLRRTADAKRVSVAWVVREAVHEYLRNQAPLFRT